MLELSGLKHGETLYDLGSGDGRIVLMAAKEFGAVGYGIEHKISLIEESKSKAEEIGVSEHVKFIQTSIYKTDLHSADVVTIYLTTRSNERIRPKLERELKNGARVVTHNFPIYRWKINHMEKVIDQNQIHTLYLYIC